MIRERNVILWLGLVVGISILMTDCSKKGCTDENAINYCSKCKKNDGSCEYDLTIGFWFDSVFYKNVLLFNQADTMKIYLVDNHGMNSYVGIYTKNKVFTQEPSCDDPSILKIKLRYNSSNLKDNCQNGGGFLGGGIKCWYLVGRADIISKGESKGVVEKPLVIYGGTYGCKLIKF